MNDTRRPRRIGRSIGALFLGFLTVVILSLGTDAALRAAGIFPPLGRPMAGVLFLLATAYRTVHSVVGSYVTARLAPNRPMEHALTGGGVGLVVSIVGAVATWTRPGLGPHWYPLALVAFAMPCAWVGGKLRVMQLRGQGN
jgi:hypothetical protein